MNSNNSPHQMTKAFIINRFKTWWKCLKCNWEQFTLDFFTHFINKLMILQLNKIKNIHDDMMTVKPFFLSDLKILETKFDLDSQSLNSVRIELESRKFYSNRIPFYIEKRSPSPFPVPVVEDLIALLVKKIKNNKHICSYEQLD